MQRPQSKRHSHSARQKRMLTKTNSICNMSFGLILRKLLRKKTRFRLFLKGYREIINFRTPGRWQYKTSPKPKVTIRKQTGDEDSAGNNETLSASAAIKLGEAGPLSNDVVTPLARSDDVDSLEGSESITTIIDDDGATENRVDSPSLLLETLKVEISTPPDFKDVYYEIATIKSPYTFQVSHHQY